MKTCPGCGKEFPTWVEINGVKRNLKSRKFCLECSPFGAHNTKPLLKAHDYGQCLHYGRNITWIAKNDTNETLTQ